MGFDKSDIEDAKNVLDALDTTYPFWRSDKNLTQGHTLATMVIRSFKKLDHLENLRRSEKSIQLAEQQFFIKKWRRWSQNNQAVVMSLHPMNA